MAKRHNRQADAGQGCTEPARSLIVSFVFNESGVFGIAFNGSADDLLLARNATRAVADYFERNWLQMVKTQQEQQSEVVLAEPEQPIRQSRKKKQEAQDGS